MDKAYLTLDEYKAFNYQDVKGTDFDKLLVSASDALDAVTRSFYQVYNLDTDMNTLRSKLFKKAVAKQISYLSSLGVSSSAELINKPQSQSIGRTSVTYGSSATDINQMLLAPEINSILAPTGLLARSIYYR